MESYVAALRAKDHQAAYGALRLLLEESGKTSGVYPYFDQFVAMLDDPSSYVRSRGLALIAANVKWDTQGKLDQCLQQYLSHITDKKPITARQCIQRLPEIASGRPDLAPRIRRALLEASTEQYAESMRPLICRDISAALAKLQAPADP